MFDFLQKYFSNSTNIIYNGIMLLAILVGAVRFSKLSLGSRFFLLLLVITPFKEMLAYYFALTYRNNSFISNPFTLLEFSLFSIAFYADTKVKIFINLLFSLLVFGIINGIFFQPFLTSQNTQTHLMASLLIIFTYFLFLVTYFKKVDTVALRVFPLFWIGLGFMFFSIVSIVSFGFIVVISTKEKWYPVVGLLIQYSNYLLYLSFIPAFLSPQKSLNNIATSK
jgi:hypothetical protein